MKNYNLSAFLIALFALASVNLAQAQYDDLYYDPDTDASYSSNDYDQYSSDDYYEEDASYSDFDDDPYDYYYTSRIRRFHRPYYGFNYYDPVYVDMAYYDPYSRPGAVTVLIYDNNFGRNNWNSWGRYNRWNSFNRYSAWNSWGNPYSSFNRWNSWNSWGSPYGYSSFGYNNFGYNSWGGVGYGGFSNVYSNYYCPPSWGNGNTYNTVYNVNNARGNNTNGSQGTYSGPRRTGTVATPRSTSRTVDNTLNQSNPRGATSRNADINARPNRTNSGSLERHTIRSGRNVGTTNSRTTVTPNRNVDRSSINNSRTRTTTRPSINSRTRSASPSRTYNRSTSPSRSYNTSPSRSYSPSRSTTPSRSYNTSPSRSSTPSRSYSPSPSRSSSGSSINRSSTPSRSSSGSSSGRTRSGGGE